MSRRDERIEQEAAALWTALHEGPPPEGCSGADLLARAVETADVAQYERLSLPWLRDRNLVWPTQA